MTANLPRRRQLAVYSRCVEPQAQIVIYRSSIFSICDILYTVKPVRSTAAASGQKSTVNGNRSHILCGRALVFTVAATAAAVPWLSPGHCHIFHDSSQAVTIKRVSFTKTYFTPDCWCVLWPRRVKRSVCDSRAPCFTGRMPFLPPNQQRQSTEGTTTAAVTATTTKNNNNNKHICIAP